MCLLLLSTVRQELLHLRCAGLVLLKPAGGREGGGGLRLQPCPTSCLGSTGWHHLDREQPGRRHPPRPQLPQLSQGTYLSPASEGMAEAVSTAACFPLGTSSTISAWRGMFVASMVGRWLGSLRALLGSARGAPGFQRWAGALEGLAWEPTSPHPLGMLELCSVPVLVAP